MSGSKLAVLGLSLLSALILLYGVLFASSPILAPEIFSVYRDPLTERVNPGCFGIPVLLFMVFLALLPAAAAFRLWRTRVRAQAVRELREDESERQLEEQVQQVMKQAVNLLLTETSEIKRSERSEAFAGEVYDSVDRWNHGRRERLFRFLSDLGLDADWVIAGDEEHRRLPAEIADSLWKRSRPIAVAAVFAWFLLSFLLLLFTVSAGFGMWTNSPMHPGEALLGALGCFIPSLITGLAGVGIGWLFFRERRASRRYRAIRDAVQELILRNCTEVLQKLSPEISGPGPSDVKRAVRALAISGTADLDGIRKGQLLSLLHQSGWLERDSGVDLRGANFQGAHLAGARFSRARLRYTDLSAADLRRADLQQADLRECNLREADLRLANLDGADLSGADLRGARIQQARMGSARLEGALFEGAHFWGADLRDTAFDDSGPSLFPHGRDQE
jgi:hypothetical protein